jgi:RNA polymerase sigma-70 factor (ECF subfamily)
MDAPLCDWDHEISKIKTGDNAAARRLVEFLYPFVVRVIYHKKPHTCDIEDIAQEVFMKVFTKIEQFRQETSFENWVARIAINTCYDRLRQQRRRRVFSWSELPDDLAARCASSEEYSHEDAAHLFAKSERWALLERLIAQLGPDEQILVRYLDLEEKSIKEVSSLTGWGESKIKVSVMRARRKLATLCEPFKNLLQS